MAVSRVLRLFVFFAFAFLATGCSSLYYSALEKVGWEKRDLMVKRVKAASEEQGKAKEEFASALDRFQSVLAKSGGDLEKKYRQLESEYEGCKSRADKVGERIASVEDVSEALFREWERELEEYKSDSLRATSERRLRETRRQYDTMIAAMQRSSATMQPVLAAFKDRVLFLKHNLNAQAIASLQGDVAGIEDDVARLIADMDRSIAESDAFIAKMEAK